MEPPTRPGASKREIGDCGKMGRSPQNRRKFPENRENTGKVGYKHPPAHTRWKAGESGNPGGRPKTKIISQAIRQLLAELEGKEQETVALVIAKSIVDQAKSGDLKAAAEIMDRVEGKPVQAVTVDANIAAVRALSDEDLVESIRRQFEELAEGVSRKSLPPVGRS